MVGGSENRRALASRISAKRSNCSIALHSLRCRGDTVADRHPPIRNTIRATPVQGMYCLIDRRFVIFRGRSSVPQVNCRSSACDTNSQNRCLLERQKIVPRRTRIVRFRLLKSFALFEKRTRVTRPTCLRRLEFFWQFRIFVYGYRRISSCARSENRIGGSINDRFRFWTCSSPISLEFPFRSWMFKIPNPAFAVNSSLSAAENRWKRRKTFAK